jgi:two-component system phosphate regulon sensor histidine kinase PhoR
VLLNLLDNAVKYTEKGEIALQAGRKGDRIEVRVSDTGVGIQDKHLPRIFERFYRVDKARSRALGGTGLGLSIVKHIIQIHGGDIQVESRVGSGTTFTIHLPAG